MTWASRDFFRMPNSFVQVAKNVGPTAFAVLAALCRRADKDGQCWPSVNTIAKDTQLSPSCVRERLGDLERAQLITVRRSKSDTGLNEPNRYQLASDYCPPSTPQARRTTRARRTPQPRQEYYAGAASSTTRARHQTIPAEQNSRTRPPSTSPKLRFTDDDLEIAHLIFDGVRQLQPHAKEPPWQTWANEVRLLRERDGPDRTPEGIRLLFAWANQDQFWRTNILSPQKLRKQWDTLTAKRNQGATNGNPNRNDQRRAGQQYLPGANPPSLA